MPVATPRKSFAVSAVATGERSLAMSHSVMTSRSAASTAITAGTATTTAHTASDQ